MKGKFKIKLFYRNKVYTGGQMDKNRVVRKERILELIENNGGKILDVGCWDGWIVGELVGKCDVYGVDIATEALKIASKRGIKVVMCDIEEGLPFKEESFDTVVASEILEHCFDTDFILSEIKRVLKPKGSLIVSVPNVCSLSSRINVLLGRLPLPINYRITEGSGGHIRGYNKGAIISQLKDIGFLINEVTTTTIVLPVPFLERSRRSVRLKFLPQLGENIIVKAMKPS